MPLLPPTHLFFFFNDTATTEIYTLSLHDALPIFAWIPENAPAHGGTIAGLGIRKNFLAHVFYVRLDGTVEAEVVPQADRKSTRLNSSHLVISYAVFCLKKKNTKLIQTGLKATT